MTINPGNTLTAVPASVAGAPTPDRSFQWASDGASISGATASTYVVQTTDIGKQITVQQTETNFLGSASAVSLATAIVEQFDPLTLFATSEPGAWYDPSDLSTMFQDTAGTTPVTATGQTVGLLLDKSKGLVLGPELVTNGTFDTNVNGWTAGFGTSSTSLAWSNGAAVVTVVAGFSNNALGRYVGTISGLTIGASYRLQFGTFSATGPAVIGWTSSSNGTGGAEFSSGQTTARIVTATATTMYVYFGFSFASTGNTLTVDNISVKELPGNHATQATAASRPIYGIEPFGGRRNLLTFTEQFDNAAWGTGSVSVAVPTKGAANSAIAPDGTNTADEISFPAIVTASDVSVIRQSITTLATSYTGSVYLKAKAVGDIGKKVGIWINDGSVVNFSWLTLSADWQRVVVTENTAATTTFFTVGVGGANFGGQAQGSCEVLIWGAQLETGSTATAYQRVTDQWNVTQAGVPSVSYLAFDGTDDFLLTGTITPGIDKAQVFAGVRVIGTSAGGMILETSVDISGNNGALNLVVPNASPFGGRGFRSKGTVQGTADTANNAYTAPITQVLTGVGDIAGDTATLRVNGTQVATSATDQGTGNYLAYPLYIGRRGGTTLPFNGRIYSLLVRFGASLTSNDLAAAEVFTNQKTGAY